jgi:hypothetical protein
MALSARRREAMNRRLRNLAQLVRERGPLRAVADVIYRRLFRPAREALCDGSDRRQLERILADNPDKVPIVLPFSIGWHGGLFQRPQHMALELARQGFVYFYGVTPRWPEERLGGFRAVSPGCYLTSRIDLVLGMDRRVVIHLTSPERRFDIDLVRRRQAKGDQILYEFIDEVHEGVMGRVDQWILDRHEALLADESIYCTASADRLFEQVAEVRTRNYALVTNGVDLGHWTQEPERQPPRPLRHIVNRGKPVIGYYGALAPWVDYGLVRAIAETGRFSVCLIGPLHMLSRFEDTGLNGQPDVYWLGARSYAELPSYAAWFDVAIIPFLLNEVTQSVSPVKLFEYMALGKRIVTTDIRECRKYRSVVVATGFSDFVTKLDAALRGDFDESHYRHLAEDARANSWAAKTAQVAALLRGKAS